MSDRAERPFGGAAPSEWIARFVPLIAPGGTVLDVACGAGRHGRYLRTKGHPVVMLDRDIADVADMASDHLVELVAADLEAGRPWPLRGRTFAGVVVTNYLYRPLFADLIASVAEGGVLIYETFARGNEEFGRPRNPDHLLRREELLILCRPELRVVAFEDVRVDRPRPAVVQRIVAVRDGAAMGYPEIGMP